MNLITALPFKSDVSDAQISQMATQIGASGAQVVLNHGSVGTYEKLIRAARSQAVRASFFGVNSGSAQLDLNGLKAGYGPDQHAGLSFVDLSIVTREGRFRH